jgi:cation transport protein ChaC
MRNVPTVHTIEERVLLTRKSLTDNDLTRIFGELPEGRYLSEEALRASLQQVLSDRPVDGPVWIFAYGSLMWNPMIEFTGEMRGFLPGWKRAFSMKLDSGRGTPEHPGRMLALVAGEGTTGMVLQLGEANRDEDLFLLWRREMCTGSYLPRWENIMLDDGKSVSALVFTMNEEHPTFDANTQPEDIAATIASASGPLGTNADYLIKLHESLTINGINDPYITQLHSAVMAQENVASSNF